MGLAASFVVALAWLATRVALVRPGDGSVGATPSVPPLDPTAVGVGVVAAPGVPWLPVLVIGAVVAGFVVVIWRTRNRWVRALAGGTLVAALAVVLDDLELVLDRVRSRGLMGRRSRLRPLGHGRHDR